MKLTKSMLYYFWSWIIFLPIITSFNWMLEGNSGLFLALVGCFGFFQFFFFGIRYFILRIIDAFRARKKTTSKNELIEQPTPFALLFSEENKPTGGLQQ